jgi:hypothetical protein
LRSAATLEGVAVLLLAVTEVLPLLPPVFLFVPFGALPEIWSFGYQ